MRERILALATLVVVVAVTGLLLVSAYWQPKSYNGTPLGLYIADGDTIVVGYVDADTANVDTTEGRRAHFQRAWIDTLNWNVLLISHLHIDTLSTDSLTAMLAHFDRADADTLDADSLHATHLAAAVIEADVAYIDYLGSNDSPVVRAWIDTLHSAVDSTAALYVNSADDGRGYAWLENYTLDTADDFWGVYGGWYKTAGASDHNDYLNGMWYDVSMNQPGGVLGGLYGFAGIAELANGQMGTPDTSRYLMGGEARTNAVGGTLYGSMIGFFNEAISYGTMDSITGDAVGTWVHTASEHVGGSTYGILLDDDTGTDYGIYQTGTSPNYLWGLDLGDSLTVAGNVHAANIYGDSLFGDGSNLTGITGSGADTTGLREEWRADIHDSLAAGGPGGVSDHGDLDSLSLLDDDHPQYLLRADFPDSFATAWPDSFTAAMTNTIAPAIHDTAEAVRADVRDTVDAMDIGWGYGDGPEAGILEAASVTTEAATPDSIWAITGDSTYVYAAHGAYGITSWSRSAGVLTRVDSVASASRCIFALHGYVYTGNLLKAYCWTSTAGVLAKTDSVTLPDNALSIHGVTLGDSTWIYVADDDGQVNTLLSKAGDITLVTTKVANNTGVGYDVWADSIWVYLANGAYGIYTFTNNRAGTLTQTDNDDPGDAVAVSVWGDPTHIYAAYQTEGVRCYTRSGSTLTEADLNDPGGDYTQSIYTDGEFIYSTVVTFMNGLIVYSVDSMGTLYENSRYTMSVGAVPLYSSLVWSYPGEGYLFFAGLNRILTLQHVNAYSYNHTTRTHTFPATAKVLIEGDSTVVAGNLSIDVDGTPTAKAYDLSVYNGAAYSRLEAGSDLITSSSRKLKHIMGTPGPSLGASVLQAIVDMPLYWWRWKEGDTQTQHIGPVAEDFFKVGKKVAPLAATDSTIAGEHEVAALFVAVKELSRRNDSLGVALAASEKRMANLEKAWGAHDTKGTKPRRPRLDKPPERPEPQPRRGPVGAQHN